MDAPPYTLSSRPKRSVGERSAVLLSGAAKVSCADCLGLLSTQTAGPLRYASVGMTKCRAVTLRAVSRMDKKVQSGGRRPTLAWVDGDGQSHATATDPRSLSLDRTQWTTFTPGLRAAVMLTHGDHQRVELIQERQAKFLGVVGKCGIHKLLHMPHIYGFAAERDRVGSVMRRRYSSTTGTG